MEKNIEVGFKTGDRVRKTGTQGPVGTVERVRIETMRETIKVDETEPPSVTVTVMWDNGTCSHFVPGGLEKI
ncbi:MAG TPA: hypothetical protein PLP17_15695 [Oligoflexia bacterium]|nr:hypothetical protein [Oligoflexia bacterium]